MVDTKPLWQQLLVFALTPLIMAVMIRVLSRGWAHIVQGGEISETTKKRQRLEFWGALILMYIMGISMFAYAHLR